MIINKGDVVIDLGAAPGDFSAVCLQKGASKIYAFEPEKAAIYSLEKTSALNGGKIEIIDERLSSQMAEHIIGGNKNVDSLAAQILLQNYLDKQKA